MKTPIAPEYNIQKEVLLKVTVDTLSSRIKALNLMKTEKVPGNAQESKVGGDNNSERVACIYHLSPS